MRQNDIRTEVTIRGVVKPGFNIPTEGQKITYIGKKTIGWKFATDRHGYAILHLAEPIEVDDEPRDYIITESKPGHMYGAFPSVTITGYAIKTTIE